ncbi:hypothetical protein FACS1894204_05700 [Synergistales bacterium]|nr:hypothetical protein FACS1894204_05700 [Synergistales bacterium]
MNKKTVVFDFDGVVHAYTSGWKGFDVITDPVVKEAADAISVLRSDGYEVIIVSTRCAEATGLEAVKKYLTDNNIEVDDVVTHKPPALAYIDDRAICFTPGIDIVSAVKNLVPWHVNAEYTSKE